MKKNTAIQKFIASLLLLFFTISFIPKAYFHDVIASHKDTVVDCEHTGKTKTCVHQKGFSCSFTDLVVNTPYVHTTNTFQLDKCSDYFHFTSPLVSFHLQHCFFGKVSRGPPATA